MESPQTPSQTPELKGKLTLWFRQEHWDQLSARSEYLIGTHQWARRMDGVEILYTNGERFFFPWSVILYMQWKPPNP